MTLPIIREAREEDSPHLSELATGLMEHHVEIDPFYALKPEFREIWETYAKTLIQKDDALVLVAEHERVLVGYSIATIQRRVPIYTIERVGEITDCYVNPTFRDQHIGQILVEHCLFWLKENGITDVGLQVDSRNINSVKFWERRGFENYMQKMKMEVDE